MNKQELIAYAKSQFTLDPKGYHGYAHWARVYKNGMALCDLLPGADRKVVTLFSFLHDCKRLDENADSEHGLRAAHLIRALNNAGHIRLNTPQASRLISAVSDHSHGFLTAPSITVQACWDADRLDLPRVGIKVDPARLCTDAARVILAARNNRRITV